MGTDKAPVEYQGDIIRPPSEAFSIILQVAIGCSHNRCTFCGAYRDRSFHVKPWDRIERDLDFAASWCRRQSTCFLPTATLWGFPMIFCSPCCIVSGRNSPGSDG
jgi:radical SAM superfamily enzyme YgiQ (UPF0313 family)